MEEKHFFKRILAAAVIALLLIPPAQLIGIAEAKLDCGPVTNKGNDLPRTAAIGTNPAGTGAHASASGLAAVASKTTPVSGQSPALQRPQRLDAAVGKRRDRDGHHQYSRLSYGGDGNG